MDTALSRAELTDMLPGLKRLLEANGRELLRIKAEIEALQRQYQETQRAGSNIGGSISMIEKALNLPSSGVAEVTEVPQSPGSKNSDATSVLMRIVAEHQDSGGIDIDSISDELKRRGVFLKSRDYLHTILNRKKNHQKKLIRTDGKWFLTERGKEEVKARS